MVFECVQTFFSQYHLLLLVLGNLPFIDLLRFGHLPGVSCKAADYEIGRRIFFYLAPFIPKNQLPTFFRHLHQCKGFITGPVVRNILLHNQLAVEPSKKLTIIIAHRAPTPIHALVKNLGYTAVLESSAVGDYISETVARQLWERVDDSGESFQIDIVESRRQPLGVLFKSDNTADMLAISRERIVCYYPRLLWRDDALLVNKSVTDISTQAVIQRPDGVVLRSDNSHWTKPCGVYCPAIWRHSYDDDGVLKATWTCPREEDTKAAGTNGHGVEADDGGRRLPSPLGEMDAEAAGTNGHGVEADDGGRRLPSSLGEMDAKAWDWDAVSGWNGPVHWGSGWDRLQRWNRHQKDDDFTYSEILRWKITNRCRNTSCPNSHLHDVRSEYITL